MNIARTTYGLGILFGSLLFTTAGWAEADTKVDAVSGASPAGPMIDNSKELPVRKIPDMPPAAEAYYAPDDYHLIVQARDPDAQQPKGGRIGGALT